jgi:hypothetical protein
VTRRLESRRSSSLLRVGRDDSRRTSGRHRRTRGNMRRGLSRSRTRTARIQVRTLKCEVGAAEARFVRRVHNDAKIADKRWCALLSGQVEVDVAGETSRQL